MKNSLFLAVALILFACNPAKNKPEGVLTGDIGTGNVVSETVNVDEYKLEEVPGTNWQRAVKLDTAGKVLETGFFEAGKKVGSWVSYEGSNKQFPSQVATYKDGKLNGLYIKFNDGGQAGLIAFYQNNLLHGHWGKYQFGRVAEDANYINGKLDGTYNIYTLATGNLQTSAEYKNGIQEGYYRTYTPEGQVTTEYLYKNGEKVSGGVVMPSK